MVHAMTNSFFDAYELKPADLAILESSTDLGEFWAKAHENLNSFWTSGTNWEYIKDVFQIDSQQIKNQNVLVVGVGQGTELAGVHLSGARVAGYDLFVPTLKTLEGYQIYTPLDLPPKNEFDLVLCHLVFQHCDDSSAIEILSLIAESLKGSGVGKIQFSIPIASQDDGENPNLEVLKCGLNHRSVSSIYKLIASVNLVITEFNLTQFWKELDTVHATVMVRKVFS